MNMEEQRSLTWQKQREWDGQLRHPQSIRNSPWKETRILFQTLLPWTAEKRENETDRRWEREGATEYTELMEEPTKKMTAWAKMREARKRSYANSWAHGSSTAAFFGSDTAAFFSLVASTMQKKITKKDIQHISSEDRRVTRKGVRVCVCLSHRHLLPGDCGEGWTRRHRIRAPWQRSQQQLGVSQTSIVQEKARELVWVRWRIGPRSHLRSHRQDWRELRRNGIEKRGRKRKRERIWREKGRRRQRRRIAVLATPMEKGKHNTTNERKRFCHVWAKRVSWK